MKNSEHGASCTSLLRSIRGAATQRAALRAHIRRSTATTPASSEGPASTGGCCCCYVDRRASSPLVQVAPVSQQSLPDHMDATKKQERESEEDEEGRASSPAADKQQQEGEGDTAAAAEGASEPPPAASSSPPPPAGSAQEESAETAAGEPPAGTAGGDKPIETSDGSSAAAGAAEQQNNMDAPAAAAAAVAGKTTPEATTSTTTAGSRPGSEEQESEEQQQANPTGCAEHLKKAAARFRALMERRERRLEEAMSDPQTRTDLEAMFPGDDDYHTTLLAGVRGMEEGDFQELLSTARKRRRGVSKRLRCRRQNNYTSLLACFSSVVSFSRVYISGELPNDLENDFNNNWPPKICGAPERPCFLLQRNQKIRRRGFGLWGLPVVDRWV